MKRITNYIKSKHGNFCLRREPVEFPMSFHDSIFQVSEEHWTQVQKINNNLYLSYDYLKALEVSQQNIDFRYILFYKNNKPVAIAYIQVLQVKLADSIKDAMCSPMNFGKNLLGGKESKFFVCGNVFSSGENGFAYTLDLSQEDAYKALMNGIYRLRRAEKVLGEVTSVILKEFWEKNYDTLSVIKKYDYRDFEIEPNLVMKINSEWNTLDDYIDDITKKYRKKYKDVMKKSEAIVSKDLNAADILFHSEKIKELFYAVHEKADFKFGHFDASGFHDMKKSLGEQFIFKAYFLNDEMLGFAALFNNSGVLDANYVGLNYELNTTHCIYHRMLFDFVQVAMDKKCSELHYGRTASEIKSSIGAVPVNMKIFIRHRNTLSNKLIKPLLKLIQPSPFEQRNPFKETAVATI